MHWETANEAAHGISLAVEAQQRNHGPKRGYG